MKNLKWLLAAVLFISFNIYSVAGDKKIKFKALPRMAQEFYNLNFGKMKIKYVEYDSNDKKYEIEMWNDNSIKFNSEGEWEEIDFDKNTPIPASVINTFPMLARTAFMKKYSGCQILEIDRNLSDPSDIHYKIKMISSQTSSNFTIILKQDGEMRKLTL